MSDATDAHEETAQLVVIGASAGGVEALLTLVESLPVPFPAPIVIAQHIDPQRPSQLASLLASRTALAVQTVTGREALHAGTIYVIPADRNVEIEDHYVDVHQPELRASAPSVDHLLATAARVYGDDLIAVVLTGTGSDGAAGAQAVKAYGGTVIVQNPETARFPGMPRAVAPASVDIVADLEAIGPLLGELIRGAYTLPAPDETDELRALLDQIRERTGLDFASYKRPTIARRLQRRMAAAGTETLADYRRYVERNPDELQRLVASFLIKVTEFFRDPELFDYLRDQILPNLLAQARERGELRIWSAGCATGEEAYSLAMLIVDLLGDELESLTVRIFATDIALDAIDFARRGIYPASALEHLPPDLVERHFIPHDGAYEVRKAARGLVIFGDHDLGHRAPFPRIDLVLCRNVLIYFTAELQRRALQLFAFSLRPGGYLVLGKSESVNPLPEFFALEQPRLKIFRRVGSALPIPVAQVLDVAPRDPSGMRSARRALARSLTTLDLPTAAAPLAPRTERLLDTLTSGVATVNRDYDILSINSAARDLLGITTGAVGEDIVHRVESTLARPLRGALDRALRGETVTIVHRCPPDLIDSQDRDIAVVCSPLSGPDGDAPSEVALIEVVDVSSHQRRLRELEEERERLQAEQATLRERAAAAVAEVQELRNVNRAMASEQGHLRMEVEYLQLAHEEAQAAAEEIETLNEEQQATNEELETVNEELQATVEELQATIGELSATNEELETRSQQLETMAAALEEQQRSVEVERSRLAAILANMGDAVLVVNDEAETVLTNAAYERLFGPTADFVPEDESGHPLPAERWPQRRAARGEAFTLAFTLRDQEGTRRSFESNVQPVQGGDEEHWGVIVIRDITERSLRRQQEQFLAVAAHELRTPLTVLSGRIQLLVRRLASARADERLMEHASRALEQARNLEADIDELMDAARLQFGKITLERAPVDLVEIAHQAVDSAEALTIGQAIHVEAPAHPLMVDGDRRRLTRVLLNLLSNAATYAPGTERIDVRLRQDGDAARIEVEDRGLGISADALPHIFDRFVRLEQGASSRGGLGLGLFIAREIIGEHGGTIEAQSTVGEGTTMVIRLPLLDERPSPPPDDGSAP